MYSVVISSVLLGTFLTSVRALPATSAISTTQKRFIAQVSGVPNDYGSTNWVTSVAIGGYIGNLLIDTGSADLWVIGEQASHTASQPIYCPAASNAYPGESFSIQYTGPNNYLSGFAALDSVAIAGLQVPRMPLDVATNLGSDNAGQQFDGVIGFGFQSENQLAPVQSSTFMEHVMNELDQPTFAVNFRQDGSGTIEFGGVDDTAYSGDLMSLAVDNSTGSWIVDGFSFDFDIGFTQPMVFDTGATTTFVSPSIASAYWAQVHGTLDVIGDGSGWQYPCGATLPDFRLWINGQTITLGDNALAWGYRGYTDGYCVGGLQGQEGTGSMGVNFVESYYVVYDQATPEIRLAVKA